MPRPQHQPEHRPPTGQPRHLRVVDPREPATLRRRRLVRVGAALLVAFVVALLFVAVGMHVMLAQNQFELDRLNAEATSEQATYQRLRLQVDQLASPQRIMGIAQDRFGMVMPPSVTILTPAGPSGPVGPASGGRPLSRGMTQAPVNGPDRAFPPGGRAQSAPAPATAPRGWSVIKPQLAASP